MTVEPQETCEMISVARENPRKTNKRTSHNWAQPERLKLGTETWKNSRPRGQGAGLPKGISLRDQDAERAGSKTSFQHMGTFYMSKEINCSLKRLLSVEEILFCLFELT